jgi:hypothetical protein
MATRAGPAVLAGAVAIAVAGPAPAALAEGGHGHGGYYQQGGYYHHDRDGYYRQRDRDGYYQRDRDGYYQRDRDYAAAAPAVVPDASYAPPAYATPAAGRWYTVQPGDTLCGLASRYYGSAASWPQIWAANYGRVADPDVIGAGQALWLPAE